MRRCVQEYGMGDSLRRNSIGRSVSIPIPFEPEQLYFCLFEIGVSLLKNDCQDQTKGSYWKRKLVLYVCVYVYVWEKRD